MTDTVRNLAAFKFGEVTFDGARHSTTNLSGDQFAYAEIHVPNPIPPEWFGKTSRIAAYADVNGDPPAFKWMSISKAVGEWGSPIMNAACTQGNTVTLNIHFGTVRTNAVNVQGGEVLYVNVQNRMPAMSPGQTTSAQSCGAGHQCDFTMDASIPS